MNPKKSWMKTAQYLNLAFSLGVSMVLIMLLGIYGGNWLDNRLGSSPFFLLLGIILGTGAGFYNLWSELSKLVEIDKRRKQELEEDKQHEEIGATCQIKESKNKKR